MAVPFHTALERLLEVARPPAPRSLSPAHFPNAALAEDVIAPCDLPSMDVSAMDGYAVRAEEVATASPATPCALRISGRTLAGDEPAAPLGPGRAVRIMTGAPMPEGADEVIELERTQPGDADTVSILGHRGPGGHVRKRGEDVAKGAVALPAGHEIGPAEIGLLSALGVDVARLQPPPRVAIIATGDELVRANHEPQPGQVRDAASPAISCLAHIYGAWGFATTIIADDEDALVKAFENAGRVQADIIVTIGGISGGDRDLTAGAALRAGFSKEIFRGVDMKPGHPTSLFQHADGRLLLALPGNPAAALISAELFLRAAVLTMRGRRTTVQPMANVAVPKAFSEKPGRVHWVRARVRPGKTRGTWEIEELLEGGAARLSTLARANALLWIEGEVQSGDRVRALLLKPDVVRSGWVDGAR